MRRRAGFQVDRVAARYTASHLTAGETHEAHRRQERGPLQRRDSHDGMTAGATAGIARPKSDKETANNDEEESTDREEAGHTEDCLRHHPLINTDA